jgi:hypothetical protein
MDGWKRCLGKMWKILEEKVNHRDGAGSSIYNYTKNEGTSVACH